jgi:hypothetical protein
MDQFSGSSEEEEGIDFDFEDEAHGQRVTRFYEFLRTVLTEEESDEDVKMDESGYSKLSKMNKPNENICYSLDLYFKKTDQNNIYKCDQTFETSRRSNLQFSIPLEKVNGNQSTAYKEGVVYFEVTILYWRKKKYRNYPKIGVGLAPLEYEGGKHFGLLKRRNGWMGI